MKFIWICFFLSPFGVRCKYYSYVEIGIRDPTHKLRKLESIPQSSVVRMIAVVVVVKNHYINPCRLIWRKMGMFIACEYGYLFVNPVLSLTSI